MRIKQVNGRNCSWKSLIDANKNDRRKKSAEDEDLGRNGDENRKNGDGWKKKELNSQRN